MFSFNATFKIAVAITAFMTAGAVNADTPAPSSTPVTAPSSAPSPSAQVPTYKSCLHTAQYDTKVLPVCLQAYPQHAKDLQAQDGACNECGAQNQQAQKQDLAEQKILQRIRVNGTALRARAPRSIGYTRALKERVEASCIKSEKALGVRAQSAISMCDGAVLSAYP